MTTAIQRFTTEEVRLIKETIAPDATDDELLLFVAQAERTGLDPFSKQVYAIHRWSKKLQRKAMTIQLSIDGLRLVAQRTGQYEGQTDPEWADVNGKWYDVWLFDDPPFAARVGVWRTGFRVPLKRIALWSEFAGNTSFWKDMPSQMLAKVAESQALRAAFSQELSGLYTTEEMAQADNESVVVEVVEEDVPQIEEQEEVVYQKAEVVDEYSEAETAEFTKPINELATDLYDEPEARIAVWCGHYDVGTLEDIPLDDLGILMATLVGLKAELIDGQKLKALHANARDAYKGSDDEWDDVRHKMVLDLTNGRTRSTKKLYDVEFKQLMDYLNAMQGEEVASSLFG